jgi:hypothetical protein
VAQLVNPALGMVRWPVHRNRQWNEGTEARRSTDITADDLACNLVAKLLELPGWAITRFTPHHYQAGVWPSVELLNLDASTDTISSTAKAWRARYLSNIAQFPKRQ